MSHDPTAGCIVAASGAPLAVGFHNEMGDVFRLVGAAFALDGELVFDSNDEALLGQKSFVVATTHAPPGQHELGATLIFRGHGYGVFSYLRGYRFETRGSRAFDSRESGEVTVVAFERGGAFTPVEQRPAIRFDAERGRTSLLDGDGHDFIFQRDTRRQISPAGDRGFDDAGPNLTVSAGRYLQARQAGTAFPSRIGKHF